MLLHLGYLNAFFHYEWLNPVFWTLAIEFQYYILIAVMFPLLFHKHARIRIVLLVGFCILPLFLTPTHDAFRQSGNSVVFFWLSLFGFGIASFQRYAKMLNGYAFCGVMAIVAAVNWYTMGPESTVVGLIAASVILCVDMPVVALFRFLGGISYSLYLLHLPIGSRVVHLGMRLAPTPFNKIATLFLACGASITAAWVLYRLVEAPAQKWSSRIKYVDWVTVVPAAAQADEARRQRQPVG